MEWAQPGSAGAAAGAAAPGRQQGLHADFGRQQHAPQQEALPQEARLPARQPAAPQAPQGQQGPPPSRSQPALPKHMQQEVQWLQGILEECSDTDPDENVTTHVMHVALGRLQELRQKHLPALSALHAVQQLRDGLAMATGGASKLLRILAGCTSSGLEALLLSCLEASLVDCALGQQATWWRPTCLEHLCWQAAV